MAENEDGQEKTEQPTAKKLEDARKKGQIARSRELNTMAVTLAGAMAMIAMSGRLGEGLWEVMSHNFTLSRADLFNPMAMIHHLAQGIQDGLILLAPFFLVVMIVAILASVALGGFSISGEALAPKFSKLNPINGMKRVFSMKGLMELLKALAKFLLIAGVTAGLLWSFSEELLGLSHLEVEQAIKEGTRLVGWSTVLLASTLILIALVDVPFQLWDHKKQLRMTLKELRDEMKETDGKPEVKSRIRSLQRQLAQRRMMEEVPKADVVVTNPSRFAVALKYDQEKMAAPKLVAKGTETVAANIRKVAGENEVPIIEAPLLARAIYFNTELGETIPVGLYLAVAKLLAYVFQLRLYRTDGGPLPEAPGDLPVPDEYRTE